VSDVQGIFYIFYTYAQLLLKELEEAEFIPVNPDVLSPAALHNDAADAPIAETESIEALRARVKELELENQAVRWNKIIIYIIISPWKIRYIFLSQISI